MTKTFEPFPKIRRDKLNMIVTEKMDGANCSIHIYHNEEETGPIIFSDDRYSVAAASRKRWITPEGTGEKGSDNFGFAQWVKDNAEVLINTLGTGVHFGEWCGPGIQKNRYMMDTKKFYLFNTSRWEIPYTHNPEWPHELLQVVPVLHKGVYDDQVIDELMYNIKHMQLVTTAKYCEGVVVWCPEADHLRKVTFEHSEGKWKDNG